MRTVFADTAYWLAISNPRDQLHQKALEVSQSLGPHRIITTDEVLTEFLALYSPYGPEMRRTAAQMARGVLSNPNIQVLQQTHESFLAGLNLYEQRLDKGYSLTDCISMTIMRERRIQEALTADHHFAQEGFKALLKA